jgi:DNA-damage-inducible protein D
MPMYLEKGLTMTELIAQEYTRFERIRHIHDDGSEYWSARELADVLGYTEWRNFTKVIDKAMIACNTSGRDVACDFVDDNKIVKAGVTSKEIKDYELSRYACYLIVQNGDPRKDVIALGQTYFAIQTHRQEIADRFNLLDEDTKRLIVRDNIKGKSAATATHYNVGKEVRGAIEKIGGATI